MSIAWHEILFQQPAWLLFIPVLWLVLASWLWHNPRALENWQQPFYNKSRQRYYFPGALDTVNPRATTSARHKRREFTLQFLRYAIFSGLILTALAQPYHQGKQLPNPPRYRDIVFLVDSSVTMSLKDYQYNNQRIERLGMLKSVLSHFLDSLQGNRVGVTVFSTEAYTLAPLTTDHALLSQQLQRLESAVLTGRISNPSKALLYTTSQYRASGQKPTLVMFTDIDRPDRSIDPRVAATYASQQGFRLHVIGIGAGTHQAEDDDPSSLIYQPANFQLLEEIAQAGQGQFFWAKDIASLNQALLVIKKTEAREVSTTPVFIRQPLYPPLLLAALIWLTLWQLLPARRKSHD